MEPIRDIQTQVGKAVQIRTVQRMGGTPITISGKVDSQYGRTLAVSVQEPLAPGVVVALETSDCLMLAETLDSVRRGPEIHIRCEIQQVIPIKSDLHNLMISISAHGQPQEQPYGLKVRRHTAS